MYGDDKLWLGAKRLAKLSGHKNDWTYTITYYNLSGGSKVRLYALDDNDNYYRVIANTDQGSTLLLSKTNLPIYLPTDDVVNYRKFFDFVEDAGEERELTTAEPIEGVYKVKIYE